MTYSFGEFTSHHMKEIFMYMETSKETNHEIKTNRYRFSFVSEIDVEKSCFFM